MAKKGVEEVGLRIEGGKDEHFLGGSEVQSSRGLGDSEGYPQ